MDRDRNLLFGVMAVLLRRITPAQLAQGAAAWASDPSRDLAGRLVEIGALSAGDLDLVERLAGEAVAANDGDATVTLSHFGGDEELRRSFCGVIERTPSGGVRVSSVPTIPPPPSTDSADVGIPEVSEAPGRYTRGREHGRGGIGRVLVVHDECLGREVALKELLPGTPIDEPGDVSPVRGSGRVVSRFLQEARVTGQLEHPSIVPVYELGRRPDGTVYYTMKLVRGRSLHRSLAEADTLSKRMALLPHFADLCQAVAYAHSRGVIHRDLKPSNVMVGEFGETVLIDWGLAKVRGKEDVLAAKMSRAFRQVDTGGGDDLARTARGVALGTPVYMPPEQARGDVERVDERSDIYSLGAVLYEILIGRELQDQPLLQARMMDTMGTVYLALGLYGQSEPLFEEALRLRRDLLPGDDPDVGQSLHNLASLLHARGNHRAAEPHFLEALAIYGGALPADHPETRKTVTAYAELLRDTGRDAEAAELETRTTTHGSGARD